MLKHPDLTNKQDFIHVMDGSIYNGVLDWEEAYRRGIRLMVWRGGIGEYYSDASLIPNFVAAAKAGVGLGAYLVLRPDSDAVKMGRRFARHVLEGLDAAGKERLDFEWVLDVEVKAANKIKRLARQYFKPSHVNARIAQVVPIVKETLGDPRKPWFYSNADYVNNYMGTKSQRDYLLNLFQGIIVANYGFTVRDGDRMNPPRFPRVPYPWLDKTQALNGASFWQNFADEGKNVDPKLGVWYGQVGRPHSIDAIDLWVTANNVDFPSNEGDYLNKAGFDRRYINLAYTKEGVPIGDEPEPPVDPGHPEPDLPPKLEHFEVGDPFPTIEPFNAMIDVINLNTAYLATLQDQLDERLAEIKGEQAALGDMIEEHNRRLDEIQGRHG